MSKLVRRGCMFFRKTERFRLGLLCFGLVLAAGIARGQEGRKVPITFLPPPLENATYSLGVYEAKSGKLVRRLQEIAPESAFTIGLNGLITSWDGTDDEGKIVLPGHYTARGYAVGALKVVGVRTLGNDWAADDDNLRVKTVDGIALVPEDDGLTAIVTLPDNSRVLLRMAGKDGTLLWKKPLPWAGAEKKDASNSTRPWGVIADAGVVIVSSGGVAHSYQTSDGNETANPPVDSHRDPIAGKNNTAWLASADGLWQVPADGLKKEDKIVMDKIALRHLAKQAGEPPPTMVSASIAHDKLYILETASGWQRVRGLSWVETKEENGSQVSTWQTFFERNIRLSDGPIVTEGIHAVAVPLVENPLVPGKLQAAKFTARKDAKGSYLQEDGLQLRRISENPNLVTVMLRKGKTPDQLTFLQTDGAAWDEFSIEGVNNMMEFDAGEFEMTADGEKTHTAKPAEPPDL